MPTISVLLPVFNGGSYLKACIDSVLQQTYGDFELLIGDDRSSDESGSIIHAYQDSRIRYYKREKNLGLFPNLNRLVLDSSAELIRIFCQDDILEPQCLRTEVEFFQLHPDIGMSFCKSIIINEHSEEIEKGALGDLPDIIVPLTSMQLFYYYGCIPGSLSTVCIRKTSLVSCGSFNEMFTVSGDYEMWARICRTKNLGVINQHLVRLRAHQKQLSRLTASGVQCIEQNRRIRSRIFEQLPDSIRPYARTYARLRHNVLETHHCLKLLLRGKFKDCLKIIQAIGLFDFVIAFIFWFLSLDNHLFCPRAKFAHDQPQKKVA